MAWMIAIGVAAVISFFVGSTVGKIILSSSAIAIGLLLLSLVTGFAFLVTLAKVCAAVIIITAVVGVLIAIFAY